MWIESLIFRAVIIEKTFHILRVSLGICCYVDHSLCTPSGEPDEIFDLKTVFLFYNMLAKKDNLSFAAYVHVLYFGQKSILQCYSIV